MSSAQNSPCKLPSKSKEQKREENKAYMKDKTQFGSIIEELCLKFNALVVVNKELAKHGKGAQLTMETADGHTIKCTSKDLRAQNASFVKNLKDLKKGFQSFNEKVKRSFNPRFICRNIYTSICRSCH